MKLIIPNFAIVESNDEILMINVLQSLVFKATEEPEYMCIGEDLWSQLAGSKKITFEGYTIELS